MRKKNCKNDESDSEKGNEKGTLDEFRWRENVIEKERESEREVFPVFFKVNTMNQSPKIRVYQEAAGSCSSQTTTTTSVVLIKSRMLKA